MWFPQKSSLMINVPWCFLLETCDWSLVCVQQLLIISTSVDNRIFSIAMALLLAVSRDNKFVLPDITLLQRFTEVSRWNKEIKPFEKLNQINQIFNKQYYKCKSSISCILTWTLFVVTNREYDFVIMHERRTSTKIKKRPQVNVHVLQDYKSDGQVKPTSTLN